jgi:hypothetical protein
MRDNQPLTNVRDALSYVNECIFHPTAKFTANVFSFMPEDTFTVTLFVDVVDSDSAPEYDEMLPYQFDQTIMLKLSEVPTEDHLARKLIGLWKAFLDDTWEHEAREFLRVRDDNGEYHAPFHPHHHGDDSVLHYNNGDSRYVRAGT